ncbi:DUF3320 domain-containing protein [Dyadobacter sp. CY356]|uniref:DUF3320 domain-containing protein n=1 Tax=Dyadobacter sp. CY356 TaxID=2906442 RepID=UPI001F196327|nr:DUF3320 domain-containing protein [Dyadobacter sp. CY356]MCF0055351.1 DUF3320 domain-containing protein [Dyadobacter sp. CY356]
MLETLLPKLEASRKELLDLGMRNSLLNYKVPQGRGLHIVQEKSSAIYDILVRQAKAMTFLGRPGKEEDSETDLPELTELELTDAYNDTRLQTNETEKKLQAKILNTYYFARTSIEEQGVNILYISLGMLNWYEEGNKENARQAPLILIPVSLERSSANERFRLRYTGSDVGGNLSLQAKMFADFNITLPDLPEFEELTIEKYFDTISERIDHHPSWKIERDVIELGFFSFGKFMIYHDLDSSKWPEDKKPYNNAILMSLFETGFREPAPTATEDHNLDTETNADDLYHVVDADSSQVLAMLAVQEGRHMVIQGPPGTGKSQTITNIIANAVGQGKKVLFVAEKMAALDVVKRRLDSIGLGEACLELHSHKSNKKELHEELKRILDLGRPTLLHLEQEIFLLQAQKDELNAYCSSINLGISKSGLSAQKVIGHLLNIDNETKGVQLPKINVDSIQHYSREQITIAEAMADRIQARLKDIGVPTELLFWGSRLKMFLRSDQEAVLSHLNIAYQATADLQSESVNIANYFGTHIPDSSEQAASLIRFGELAGQPHDLRDLAVEDERWLLNKDDIAELLDTGKKLSAIRNKYAEIFLPEAWDQNVLEIRQNLITHGSSFFKFLNGSYKQSNKQLASFCKTALPNDLQLKITYVDAILEAKRLENTLRDLEPMGVSLFSKRWHKYRADWEVLKSQCDYLLLVHQQVLNGFVSQDILKYLTRNEPASIASEYARILNQKIKEHRETINAVLEKLEIDEVRRSPGKVLLNEKFALQMEVLSPWKERLAEIQQVIAWNNLEETAKNDGLQFLTNASVHWSEAADFLKIAFQKTWYESLIEQAVSSSAALRNFERTSHEEVVEKFKKIDLLKLQYNRALVALKHWESVPRQEAGGQVNILRAEFNKKARHKPIRKLVHEAGLAIQAIKPVIMMSPMSIANFMAPGSIEFDLVIFDEASQVRPVEALGALLRGKQLVVVGDTKQLPPTSFFDKMNNDSEDEENVTSDMQSILGMCNGQGASERMLRWHYRSRHESLISLSNREFYENRLVIFPSPGSKTRMGLAYHHLPNTVYEKGKTSTNPKEAEYVADAVIEHALKNPKQTLGVVAFSSKQMQAIQFALEIKRRKNPAVESFFTSHPNEPFFVKNLENVQGDERDVILISIGYGRIEDGTVPKRFGPLNNEGGERRLNVLITRAKLRCEVFANIISEDIAITPGEKFGIRALRNFLYFAQHGKFNIDKEISIPLVRPFEDHVADQLVEAGYTVRRQVGSDGFFIDLAVVDNDNPGRYLLGIECDGEAYANAKSARDRDRLRRQVLEAIGWKMYRVWSTDWFRNPEKERQRLIAAIETARNQTLVDDSVEEELQMELSAVIREEVREIEVLLPVYELALLPAEVASQELHLHSLGKLGGWIQDIVAVESPIHFDEMARRLADAAGVSKVGSRIRQALTDAVRYASSSGLIKVNGDFLWYPEMKVPVIRERSNFPGTSKRLQYISSEEIQQAVRKIVETSLAIQPDSAVPLVAKLFGFSRVTEEMRKDILVAIDRSTENNLIKKDGEFLKIS